MGIVMELLEGPYGAIVMVASMILAMLCLCIWLPIVAFFVSWWWGVITLFGFGVPLFAIFHFQEAKAPFLLGVFFLFISLGTFIARAFISTFFVVAS